MARGEGNVIMEVETGVIYFEEGKRGHMPRWPLEAQKDKEMDSPLEPLEVTQTADTLILAQ